MATPTKTFDVPFRDPLVDQSGMLTQTWEWLFRSMWERLYPLGVEQSFVLVNNQAEIADITGMKFNFKGVSQAIVDFLIQRVTTSTGATQLIESGRFVLTYRPTTNEWRITLVQINNPDDSGVDFAVTPAAFTATYSHTTGLWTRANLALINGHSVKLTAGTSVPTGYVAGTKYYVISAGSSTFKLSATLGGSAVAAATNDGTGTLTVHPQNSADGQVQYTSSNITGTGSISKLFWRATTMGGKNSQYSVIGKR